MTGIIRKLMMFLSCALLLSCAGGNLTQDTDTGKKDKEVIDADIILVDVEVDLDFKNALALMEKGEFKQAVTTLKTVIEREQRLPAPYINIAISHNRLGENEAAEENLIKALKLEAAHPIANNELGLLYRKTGKFNEARTAYENAINHNPDYLPAKRNLGVLCDLYLRDFECALEQFENYLEMMPDEKDVVIWVADVKRRLGQ